MALRLIEGFSFVLDGTEGGPTYKFPYTSYSSNIAHTGVNDVIKSTGLGIPNRYVSQLNKPHYFAHLRHQRETVGFLDTRHFYPEKTWVVGEAVYFSGLMQSPSPSSLLVSFYSPSGLQCRVGVDGGGKIYATTGSGAWLGSSTLAMRPSGWYYVESKVFVDDTYGRIEVRVNEFPWLKLTNVNTRANALRSDADLIRFHVPKNFYIRDLYVCDGSGSLESDFLGDCIVEQMAPVMTGFHCSWLASDGVSTANKWTQLDENIITTFTSDYAYASSVLNAAGTFYTRPQDTYYVERITATGFYSIVAVDMQAHSIDERVDMPAYAQFATCSTILPSTGNSIIAANKKWEMSNQDYSHPLDYTYGYDASGINRSAVPLSGWFPGAHQILNVNRTMNESPNPPWTTGNLYLTQFGFRIT